MSSQKESATLSEPNQPDGLPDTAQTPFRSDEVLLADELSIISPACPSFVSSGRWRARLPQIGSPHSRSRGHLLVGASSIIYSFGGWTAGLGPSAAKNGRRQSSAGGNGAEELFRLRKSTYSQPSKPTGGCRAFGSSCALAKRPLTSSPNLCAKEAKPAAPLLRPNFGEAPWASRDPACRRAAEAGKARQRRNDVKTSYWRTGS